MGRPLNLLFSDRWVEGVLLQGWGVGLSFGVQRLVALGKGLLLSWAGARLHRICR